MTTDPQQKKSSFERAKYHFDRDEWDEAYPYAKKILREGSNPEEKFYLRYHLGRYYDEKKEERKMISSYLAANYLCPKRFEPFAQLARHYRHKGDNNSAYCFARHALELYDSEEDDENDPGWVSPHQMYEDISIVAFYVDKKNEGFAACERIILSYNVPYSMKDATQKNQFFYIKPWESYGSIKVHPIEVKCPDRFSPLNPSIAVHDGTYYVNCRTVNFINEKCQSYRSRDEDGIIRTRNFLLTLNDDFQTLEQHEIIEDMERQRYPQLVVGLEDGRIFRWKERWFMTATVMDTVPDWNPKIALVRLNPELDSEGRYHVDSFVQLQGPDPNRCEKNWLPFVVEGQLRFIYGWNPLTIYEPDSLTGKCEKLYERECELDLSLLRGSGGPISFDGGYLAVTHEVIFRDERHYFHRFVYLDYSFTVKKISLPFFFFEKKVEYSCGMTWHMDQKHLLLSVGLGDSKACLLQLSAEDVRRVLEEIE